MERFATQPPFDFEQLATQPEGLVAYYEHSDQMLQQLAQRGVKSALLTSMMKHLGRSFWADIGVPVANSRDYSRAAVFAYSLQAHNIDKEYLDENIRAIEEKLTPEQIAKAKGEAAQMIRSWDKHVFERDAEAEPDDRFGRCD